VSDEPTGIGRHEARERALALLYEGETKKLDGQALLDTLPLRPDSYAVKVVLGVDENAQAIDDRIREHAIGWKLERLPAVDRAILRLAIWELEHRHDVPTAVVIDEAVELAKEYSTEKSSGFVNGVLDAIATVVRA